VSVDVELFGDDVLNLTTGADGKFSFVAPYDLFYSVTAKKAGYSSYSEMERVLWRNWMTNVTITLKDNVAPVIARVQASHEGAVGNSFGVGQEVRIDLWEEQGELDLEGIVTIQSVGGQYFHRRKPLAYDEATGSYHYIWNTTGLVPRSDYLVTTEIWDIDENTDKDGVIKGRPDITIQLRDITPPMAPLNLSVTAPPEGGTLKLGWEANTDDTRIYTLERGLDPDGPWSFLINLTQDETSFTDMGLENGVTYHYRIQAWDSVPLASPWSGRASGIPQDLVPPGAVAGLSIVAPPDGGRLVISWTDSTDDSAEYLLYRDDGSGFEVMGTFPRGTIEFVDSAVVNKETYFYKISSRDASGNEGPHSLPIIGLAQDLTPPPMPTVDPLPELTNLTVHTVRGTAEANASVVVVVDREEALTIPVGEDGTFSGELTLGQGVNRIRFKTLDPSFNPSGLTPEVIVHVDINPPSVVSTQPFPGQLRVKVTETMMAVVSEALVVTSVNARIEFAETNVEVPSTFEYLEREKTINVFASTQLEKGTSYRVVVEGVDAAGNQLEGGAFEFSTERVKVEEPMISGSTVMIIAILVILGIVGAIIVVKILNRPPGTDPSFDGAPSPDLGEEDGYDPRTQDAKEDHGEGDWNEY
jgi:hypothetical protein